MVAKIQGVGQLTNWLILPHSPLDTTAEMSIRILFARPVKLSVQPIFFFFLNESKWNDVNKPDFHFYLFWMNNSIDADTPLSYAILHNTCLLAPLFTQVLVVNTCWGSCLVTYRGICKVAEPNSPAVKVMQDSSSIFVLIFVSTGTVALGWYGNENTLVLSNWYVHCYHRIRSFLHDFESLTQKQIYHTLPNTAP